MQRAQGEEGGEYPWVGRAGASREHIDRVLWQCSHGSKTGGTEFCFNGPKNK